MFFRLVFQITCVDYHSNFTGSHLVLLTAKSNPPKPQMYSTTVTHIVNLQTPKLGKMKTISQQTQCTELWNRILMKSTVFSIKIVSRPTAKFFPVRHVFLNISLVIRNMQPSQSRTEEKALYKTLKHRLSLENYVVVQNTSC